jgi:hypothetical protein
MQTYSLLDAGNDRIGIKTASPSTELHVVGGVKATGAIDFDGGGFTFNDSGASVDFRAETNTLAHAFFIDGSADKIGFGTDTPASRNCRNKSSKLFWGYRLSIIRSRRYRSRVY